MFYIHGGATGKKKAVREIFNVGKESDERGEYETDAMSHTSRSRSRSRSLSRVSNRVDYESNPDTDTDTDTDGDTSQSNGSNSDTQIENHDYIVTLGEIDVSHHHHRYQFIEDELDYDIEEFVEKYPQTNQIEMVIYRINTSASTPFLEFLFYCENSVCKLPHYKHETKKHVRKECDSIMDKLFTGKYRYRGYLHDSITDKCYVFYEKYFRESMSADSFTTIKKSHNWFWVCTTEIIYHKKYMSLPIHADSVELFTGYPLVGILQATIPSDDDVRVGRSSERYRIVNIEAPTILYYGSSLCYAKNTAIYGLKREPITSRFGPFYYFTTLDHSYYWACYHNTSRTQSLEKNSECGISRYAVFTKRMETVFNDDDYDVDIVKKYVERKNIFETKMNQYRQTQEKYHSGMYDSIYGQDYSWTESYDTIFNGYYNSTKIIRPVWCVCNHQNFQLLSFYQVDVTNIPKTYDSQFNDYTIM